MDLIRTDYIVGFLLVCLFATGVLACRSGTGNQRTLFKLMDSTETGIHFSNNLSYEKGFNIYTYRNFYNGGGVAIADLDNDGLSDIFFTANMLPNQLYRNKGDFKFEEISSAVGIGKKGRWSTGVTITDINADGWLDIYICNSGDVKGEARENELYINKGIQNGQLHFEEEAAKYGLNDQGLSTHASFFDFDHDGDLDMFLLNNSFRPIGSFDLRKNQRNIRDSLGGHKFFRNDNGHFTDISADAGIYGSVIGFGLGVTVGDVNKDGWDDIYVSNDFFEKDYLYINNQHGGFREALEDEMISISNASMGADLADINNDSYPDLFVTEMLPGQEARIKTNTTFEDWNKYQADLVNGYYHQFTRNMLQLNNGDNTFTDIGRYAGVAATDWSWGALISDFDNDGFKDIFVANGIYKDLTNQDYIQYISNDEFYKKVVSGNADYQEMIDLIPSNKVSNYMFANKGNLQFENKAQAWGLATPSFSNGSAYADLDNDGDLDLVVNNVNMPCFVYRNQTRQEFPGRNFLRVKLTGVGKNRYAIGAQVTVYTNQGTFYQEQQPVRGFQSSMDLRLLVGLGTASRIDSVIVKWVSGKQSVLNNVPLNSDLSVDENQARLPNVAYETPQPAFFTLSTEQYGLEFTHQENSYSDFDYQRLLFHMLSTQGPHIARADVNADGLEDVFVGGAKDQSAVLYLQQQDGRFLPSNQSLLAADKQSEDVDAAFFDADNDGDADLYVCSGGSEFPENAVELIDRLYINDGNGNFSRSAQVLPGFQFGNSSCVRAADFDADGDLDLFVGSREKPMQYGRPVKSFLLLNDGKGKFSDVTGTYAPMLEKGMMITDAAWADMNGDGLPDLVLAGDYAPIQILINSNGTFDLADEHLVPVSNGWWNRIRIADINKDGRPDIIAVNHGLNSRFKASEQKPVQMYVSDFDGNGTVEQVITCYNADKSYPMALRHDLVGALPALKKKYLRYDAYRNQQIGDIFSAEQLSKAAVLEANELASVVFINKGNMQFNKIVLPAAAQMTSLFAIDTADLNRDGNADLILAGNFYESKPEVGIYDGSYGLLLLGDGKGNFRSLSSHESGLKIRGAVRDLMWIREKDKDFLLVARNNEALQVWKRR